MALQQAPTSKQGMAIPRQVDEEEIKLGSNLDGNDNSQDPDTARMFG